MDYDLQIGTFIARHNTATFDNIGKEMDKLVKQYTKKRTLDMVKTLKFRENLGHYWGHFPKSQFNKPHSHTSWKWSPTTTGYQIQNEAEGADGYPYVRNLVAGTGWSPRVMSSDIGGPKSRLVRNNGRVFSSQMPFGINPWILHQRTLLIQDIKLATGDKIIRNRKY